MQLHLHVLLLKHDIYILKGIAVLVKSSEQGRHNMLTCLHSCSTGRMHWCLGDNLTIYSGRAGDKKPPLGRAAGQDMPNTACGTVVQLLLTIVLSFGDLIHKERVCDIVWGHTSSEWGKRFPSYSGCYFCNLTVNN